MNTIEPRRPRPLPSESDHRWLLLAPLIIFLVITAFGVRSCAGWQAEVSRSEMREEKIAEFQAEAERSAELTEMYRAERDALRSEVERLTSEVESATAAVRAVEEDNESLRNRLRDAPSSPVTPATPSRGADTRADTPAPSGAVWTREKVEVTLLLACQYHGIPEAEHPWVISKGADIAYKESTYRTDARNGQHIGLFQFNDNWATEAQRLDPVWSCYRFVQAYKDGGQANIRRHWAATY